MKKILVVEDEEIIAKYHKTLLSMVIKGAQVDVAEDEFSALSLWRDNKYDASILDGHFLEMKGYKKEANGIDLARKFAEYRRNPKERFYEGIWIVSGDASHIIHQAREKGIHAFSKPVSPDFYTTIKQFLDDGIYHPYRKV